MGEHVLVPFDGSPLSQRALDRALRDHAEDRITVLYVIDPVLAVYEAELEGLPGASSWFETVSEHAEEVCARASEQADQQGCAVTTVTETGRPARTIIEYAADHGVDHIILGSHGREGVSRFVLGSVAERVMRQSPVPVTVVR